ncbi:carboxylesterase [Halobacillus locisalis]|uniref:Carboxylesterase n=1 Tax=Halobacillus locisalis TaxID=220753 RepID=A0A838CW01_9BACI|nr:carboxylesterase [Halobacillus locisalis]MBA2176009.1 carboxylesterase [Halobacillus locisalis]
MKHFFHYSDESAHVFILLHGMGGRETDLLPVSAQLDPSMSVLGIRGEVGEKGNHRYFTRLENGSFDKKELQNRTEEIIRFIQKKAENIEHLHLIGYSNGANMAASLLTSDPDLFTSALLFHPSISTHYLENGNLEGKKVLMTAGAIDQQAPPGQTAALKKFFTGLGASASLSLTDHGHELMKSEFDVAAEWWKSNEEDGEV